MSTTSHRMSAPTPTSLRPTPRLRPAQTAPVRRGQPAGDGIPCGGIVGWANGCTPSSENPNDTSTTVPFAGGDED
jgi:hypothetical protein